MKSKNRIINEVFTQIEEEEKKFNKDSISKIEKYILDFFGAGYEDSFVKHIVDEEELFIIYKIEGYDDLFFRADWPSGYSTDEKVLFSFLYKELGESEKFEDAYAYCADYQRFSNVQQFCQSFAFFSERVDLKKQMEKKIEKGQKPSNLWQKIKARR
jgi:hypothetical protein